ncbi:unnamed protein product [Ceutorhynchus assimilis]|uniref:Uncharacterized protein n=1 Tax=Ceutorhynchus assimilis TaxID=467358 RepID=A0A9P0GKU1_9CUCU|nr:unnamed protein product [Ceutorhynchus assimilis]
MLWQGVLLCATFVFIETFETHGFAPFIDTMSILGKSLPVTVFGCNKKELMVISKQLMSNGYSNKCVHNSRNFFELDFPKKGWFVLDLDCHASSKILKKANKKNMFVSPFHWIVTYKSNQILEEIFENLAIMVDSDFNLAEKQSNGDVIFTKIFKKHADEPKFEIEDYGIWNKTKGFIKTQKISKKRKNLEVTLKTDIVLTNNNSYKHLTDRRDKHIDSIGKVNYVLLLLLASIYNISLDISVSDSWGYKVNDSEWTGMMGKLVRKEADIGGTSLFITKERVDLIDYIAMISPTRSYFVFRQPKLSYVTNVYTLPFDTQVWISVIALVILMMASLFLIMKWEITKIYFRSSQETEIEEFRPDVTFITIGAVCQQGASALPHSTPGRIATLFLFLSLMFLYVSYSANIVALLQTSSTSIKTLKDLLNSRIPVGVDDTVYNHFYFKTADEPIRKALYEKKVVPPGKKPNFMHIEEGVRRMRQGLFAFHMEAGSGYKIVGETFREDEKCGLKEISFIQVVDPWFAIQKNSSYKELLKIGFRLLQESGLQQRENYLIYTRKPQCTSKSSTFFSVGIIDCYPAAVVLVGGVSASVSVFLLEFYAYFRCKKRIYTK